MGRDQNRTPHRPSGSLKRVLMLASALFGAGTTLTAGAGCSHHRRDSWQRPDEVMAQLALEGAEQVADLGSGDGYFTYRLAEAVGAEGRVFAVDVDGDVLEELAEGAKARGLTQIQPVLADLDDAKLPEASLDLVLVVNTYHHLENRVAYMRRLGRALRTEGELVVIEIDRVPWYIPIGAHRTPPETIRSEMSEAGFDLVRSWDGLDHQSFQVFRLAPRAELRGPPL